MKNPEDIKESVQGVMSDSEMIKSLQDDLRKAREDRDRLVDGFNEAQEKNLKYETAMGYFKTMVTDFFEEAVAEGTVGRQRVRDIFEEAVDTSFIVDQAEDQILRRFDISQYDDDIEDIIVEFIKYDPRLDDIVAEKLTDILSDCRIVPKGVE